MGDKKVTQAFPVSIPGFGLALPYEHTAHRPLQNLALNQFKDEETKKIVYQFPFSKKAQVEALINETLAVSPITRTLPAKGYKKGKGKCKIIGRSTAWDLQFEQGRKIDCYVLEVTTGNGEVELITASFARVEKMWDVIAESLKPEESAESKTVAKWFFEAVGVERFNRQLSGTFDGDKAWATRTKYAWWGIYYALKVLQAENLISYSAQGTVTRKAEKFSVQMDLEFLDLEEDRE